MPRNMLHPLKKDLGLVKKWGSQRRKTPKKSAVGTALKKSLDFQPASLPLRVVTGILLTKEQSFLDRTIFYGSTITQLTRSVQFWGKIFLFNHSRGLKNEPVKPLPIHSGRTLPQGLRRPCRHSVPWPCP